MLQHGRRTIICFSSILISSLTGCGDPTVASIRDESQVESLIIRSVGSRWKTSTIPICFVNPGDVSSNVIANLKQHTLAQLQRTGVVTLAGWGTCTAKDNASVAIRVRFLIPQNPGSSWGGGISQVGPSKYGLGVQNALYATLANARTSPTGGRDGSGRSISRVDMGTATLAVYMRSSWPQDGFGQRSQKGTFLHEIGHALGLYHEQDRLDSNCKVSPQANNTLKEPVGPYDTKSLMNYCASSETNGGCLTAGDIAGIQKLFSRK